MYKKTDNSTKTLASPILNDAYLEFRLSRETMNCTDATLEFYNHTAGQFLFWCEGQGISTLEQITSHCVREYLTDLRKRNRKDTTLHANARAIRTFLRFCYLDSLISAPVKFEMPRLEKKRLPVLTAEQVEKVARKCNVRDRALVYFMVDSGLRRSETIKLNWGDVNLNNGLVRVIQGKGRKDRASVVGPTTRRFLLKYRRKLWDVSPRAPLFQTQTGDRFTADGFVQIFHRLTKRTGIYVSPHCLRRTFVSLALENKMDVVHLQGLGGWESLHMVTHYAQMTDHDLIQAHLDHSPVENLKK